MDSDRVRDHLTDVPSARLKPVNIYQAACRDLRLYERKQEDKAEPEERYSFWARHVKRATTPAHLIGLAYFEAARTDKLSTLDIYNQTNTLLVTLKALLNGATEDDLRKIDMENA